MLAGPEFLLQYINLLLEQFGFHLTASCFGHLLVLYLLFLVQEVVYIDIVVHFRRFAILGAGAAKACHPCRFFRDTTLTFNHTRSNEFDESEKLQI